MLDVREELEAERAVNAANLRWRRADEAWDAIVWTLARDPYGAGPPVTESGRTRVMVFDGARSIDMPSVRVVYVIHPDKVVVHEAVFEDSSHTHAGRA